jgi:hypothetical protein
MQKGHLTTRPGLVQLTVHDAVPTAKMDAPTVADARALAMRIEAIVRSGVERAGNI